MNPKNRLFLIAIPFVLILFDLLFGFSSTLGDRKVFLSLFMAIWMVSFWILEILPLGITALIPLFYLPLLHILPIKTIAPSYSHPVIFLFLGGFIIARALEKTKLSERIAILALIKSGKSDSGIIWGFIGATAFLSMWISNTATTVMMVPIGLSVIQFLNHHLDKKSQTHLPNFCIVLFLSIAYSANIGGVITPIGTPPNVVFMGYLDEMYGRNVDFYRWASTALPIALLLIITMSILLKVFFPYQLTLPKNFRNFITERYKKLGQIDNPQKITISIFCLAVFLWTFKGLIHWGTGLNFLNDTSIAIFCGLLLFLIPTSFDKTETVLNQKDIPLLPWNIVLLFGGGLSLATTLKEVGIIEKITTYFSQLQISEPFILILIFAAFSLFLTEIMSNLALCVIALPLIMKIGEAQGIDPLFIAMPAALCASFAFSLPISTPPNAIVFGTEKISVKQMLKAGIPLNFVALAITVLLSYLLIPILLL